MLFPVCVTSLCLSNNIRWSLECKMIKALKFLTSNRTHYEDEPGRHKEECSFFSMINKSLVLNQVILNPHHFILPKFQLLSYYYLNEVKPLHRIQLVFIFIYLKCSLCLYQNCWYYFIINCSSGSTEQHIKDYRLHIIKCKGKWMLHILHIFILQAWCRLLIMIIFSVCMWTCPCTQIMPHYS